jgi:hypothetical protein
VLVGTRIEQELEAPTRNSRKQTIRFGKSDDLILSGPMTVRSATGLR